MYRWQIESELDLTFAAVDINMKTSSARAVTHAIAIRTGGTWPLLIHMDLKYLICMIDCWIKWSFSSSSGAVLVQYVEAAELLGRNSSPGVM